MENDSNLSFLIKYLNSTKKSSSENEIKNLTIQQKYNNTFYNYKQKENNKKDCKNKLNFKKLKTNKSFSTDNIKIINQKYEEEQKITNNIINKFNFAKFSITSNNFLFKRLDKNKFNFTNIVSKNKLKKCNNLDNCINSNNTILENNNFNKNNILSTNNRYLNFIPIYNLDHSKYTNNIDNGYYYYISINNDKLIKYTLEENGFISIEYKKDNSFKYVNYNIINKKHNKSYLNKNNFFNNKLKLNPCINIYWLGYNVDKSIYSKLYHYQKINHFPKINELTRKDLLYNNIIKLYLNNNMPKKEFGFIPKSFIIPNEISLLDKIIQSTKNKLFIVKPVCSSQGRGIYFINKIQDMYVNNKTNAYNQCIVSEYIHNPFLISGFKFDLRVYFLVTSLEPLSIYMYDDGLVRFAAEAYYFNSDINSKEVNVFSHLTNYAINKNNINYVHNNNLIKNRYGSKWSIEALKNYLKENNIDYVPIFDKIKDIAIKSIISGEYIIYKEYKSCFKNKFCNNCFELLGFDILITNNLEPKLIEINMCPNMHCDSLIDLKIKSKLISDCFNIIMTKPVSNSNVFLDTCNKEYDITILDKIILEEIKDNFNDKIVNNLNINEYIRLNYNYLTYLIYRYDQEKYRCGNFVKIFPSIKSAKYLKYLNTKNIVNSTTSIIINIIFALKELYGFYINDYSIKNKIKYQSLINNTNMIKSIIYQNKEIKRIKIKNVFI